MTDDQSPLPDELDEGLAFAYGEESTPPPSPSVVERIGELTGSKPRVLLRDDAAGDTPMLKPLAPDDRVDTGKYVVHGELGRGGVGTVHRGHDQDLGRDVAMKFLHVKYKDDPAILHRFVEEAQIGGQLQHPGIVPVYDLGMVDGKPFFSMKLVKGQTLAKKLAERESPSDDRRTFLAIFEDVCQTLAYAHARGVVHRDLKPANIMIGSFGEVQVVDWGMGKVMQSGGVADEKLAAERRSQLSVIETVRSAGHGTQSLMGSVMGTPAYMPPEQARGDVEAMDERSDVFALGAILCEILTGLPPYVGESEDLIGMAAMAELDGAHARLEACGGEPEMIKLAMRCLMPAPAARPKSAEVVAKAVHDHLAAVESRVHEARVEAAEAKVRAAALRKTQKLGVALTTVITAGLVASLWFWREANAAADNERIAKLAAVQSAQDARESERRAETAEAEALARAEEFELVVEFQSEQLSAIEPAVMGANLRQSLLDGIPEAKRGALAESLAQINFTDLALTTLEDNVFERTIEAIDKRFESQPLVRARLLQTVGMTLREVGLHELALDPTKRALAIRRKQLGNDHPDTLVSVNSMGFQLQAQGNTAESEPFYREALDGRRRVLGHDHPDTLISINNMGYMLQAKGKLVEAEKYYREALEGRRRLLGGDDEYTLTSIGNMGVLLAQQGNLVDSEPFLSEALEGCRRALGDDHPITIRSINNMGELLVQQGKLAEAEPYHREALEGCRRVLGDDHPNTLMSISNMGALLHSRGKLAEAERYHREALEARRRILGNDHPDTLTSINNIGAMLMAEGKFAEAEPYIYETLEGFRRALGLDHPNTLTSMNSLAQLLQLQGKLEEAEPYFREALEGCRRALGDGHPSTLNTIHNLGMLLLEQGHLDEANVLGEEAVRGARAALGNQHVSVGAYLHGHAGTLTSMGRYADAEERALEAYAVLNATLGDRHDRPRGTAALLVRLYVAYHEAEPDSGHDAKAEEWRAKL